jgi:hypothetical protein
MKNAQKSTLKQLRTEMLLMHSKAHAYIAKQLFGRLGLPKDYEKTFIAAIVQPDQWRRRNPRRKHHYLQQDTVFGYLMGARRAYIKGKVSSCLWSLGIALHFIQDAFVPSPRTRRLQKIHARLEGVMEFCKSELQSTVRDAINEGFMIGVSSPKFIKTVLSNVRWIYDEKDAVTMIAKTSAMVTSAVFGPKDPPSGLHAKYKVLKEKHNKRVLKAFVISLTSIIVGSALTLFFTSFLAILFPIFFLVAPTLSYAKIVAGDIEFYEAKEEAEWYGIE